jgi:hypothetical protein
MTAAPPRRRPQVPVVPQAADSAPGLVSDFGREQLAIAMETSSAVLRGFEAARAIQQRAAQDASARHRAAAGELRSAATPQELLAIPFALWQADLDAAGRSWQALIGAALEAQTEILGCACSHVFDSESALETASLVDAVDRWPGAAMLPWWLHPTARSANG